MEYNKTKNMTDLANQSASETPSKNDGDKKLKTFKNKVTSIAAAMALGVAALTGTVAVSTLFTSCTQVTGGTEVEKPSDPVDITDDKLSSVTVADIVDEAHFAKIDMCLRKVVDNSIKAYKLVNSSNIIDATLQETLISSLEDMMEVYNTATLDEDIFYSSKALAIIIGNSLKVLSVDDREKFLAGFGVLSADRYLEFYSYNGVADIDRQKKSLTFTESPTVIQKAKDANIPVGKEEDEIYKLIKQISEITGINDNALRYIIQNALIVNGLTTAIFDEEIYRKRVAYTTMDSLINNSMPFDNYKPNAKITSERSDEYLRELITQVVNALSLNIVPDETMGK